MSIASTIGMSFFQKFVENKRKAVDMSVHQIDWRQDPKQGLIKYNFKSWQTVVKKQWGGVSSSEQRFFIVEDKTRIPMHREPIKV